MGDMARAYDVLAKIYDIPFGWIFEEGRHRTMELLDLGSEDRVLELGVGTGLTLPLYPEGVDVVGIDICQPMMEGALERVAEDEIAADVRFSLQDATHLAFQDDAFDVVTAFYVMSVLPDPRATLAEMARVVKPGGRIIFVNHFQRERGLLAWLERLTSPIFHYVGFRTDLKLSALVEDQEFVDVDRVEKVNLLGYWSLVECTPHLNGERPVEEEVPASGTTSRVSA